MIHALLLASLAAAGEPAPPGPLIPSGAPAVEKPAEKPAAEKPTLLPPKPPQRAKNSLDSAGDVARDLAAAVEYFEAGQSYYRAFTKGSHTSEENRAFVQFLEDYEREQAIARKTHEVLGAWLQKKSGVKQ